MKQELSEILKERESQYGSFETQGTLGEHLFFIMEKYSNWRDLTPPMRYALRMILLKVSRIGASSIPTRDSLLDIQGYAQLALNLMEEEDVNIPNEQC